MSITKRKFRDSNKILVMTTVPRSLLSILRDSHLAKSHPFLHVGNNGACKKRSSRVTFKASDEFPVSHLIFPQVITYGKRMFQAPHSYNYLENILREASSR